jgi:hypothetical protein
MQGYCVCGMGSRSCVANAPCSVARITCAPFPERPHITCFLCSLTGLFCPAAPIGTHASHDPALSSARFKRLAVPFHPPSPNHHRRDHTLFHQPTTSTHHPPQPQHKSHNHRTSTTMPIVWNAETEAKVRDISLVAKSQTTQRSSSNSKNHRITY